MMNRGWETGPVLEPGRSKRDSVELALMMMARMDIDMDELRIRLAQAITRSAVVSSVLAPGIERLSEMTDLVETARRELRQVWLDGQSLHWK